MDKPYCRIVHFRIENSLSKTRCTLNKSRNHCSRYIRLVNDSTAPWTRVFEKRSKLRRLLMEKRDNEMKQQTWYLKIRFNHCSAAERWEASKWMTRLLENHIRPFHLLPKALCFQFPIFSQDSVIPGRVFPSTRVTRIDASPPEGRGYAFGTVRPNSSFPRLLQIRRTVTFSLAVLSQSLKNLRGPQVLRCVETLFRSERRLPFVAMRGSVHKKERGRIIYLYILYTFT